MDDAFEDGCLFVAALEGILLLDSTGNEDPRHQEEATGSESCILVELSHEDPHLDPRSARRSQPYGAGRRAWMPKVAFLNSTFFWAVLIRGRLTRTDPWAMRSSLYRFPWSQVTSADPPAMIY